MSDLVERVAKLENIMGAVVAQLALLQADVAGLRLDVDEYIESAADQAEEN
jgi:hypothetical protein